MIPIRVCSVLLLCFLFGGCFPKETRDHKESREQTGVIIVYLQPLLQGADHLQFSLAEIYAVREDGLQLPLSISGRELDGTRMQGQQNLANGFVPPGAYSGISIKIEKAFLRGEEGKTALYVPEEPLYVQQVFDVTPIKAAALFLSFNPTGAAAAGIRFTPLFSLAGPEKVISSLSGYVSCPQTNTIAVFNKKTVQVVDVIATGAGPKGLVLDQERGRVYVALSGDDAIRVIDVLNNTAVEMLKLNFQDQPTGLALSRDGRTLVSVNPGSNTASVIDALSLIEIQRIRVGEGPISAVISPSGLRAFILNGLSNSISVIDLSQRQLAATIVVEGSPVQGAFSRSGDRFYVVSPDSPNLVVINPLTLTVTEKIYVGIGADAIRVDPRTDVILVGSQGGGGIDFIDPFSQMRIDTIEVNGNVADMTVDGEENSLFIALSDKQTVQKANLTSKNITAALEVEGSAYAVVVMGEK